MPTKQDLPSLPYKEMVQCPITQRIMGPAIANRSGGYTEVLNEDKHAFILLYQTVLSWNAGSTSYKVHKLMISPSLGFLLCKMEIRIAITQEPYEESMKSCM